MKARPDRRWADMSPEAIDRRLRDLAQLWRLAMEIRGARRIGKAEDLRTKGPADPSVTPRRDP